VLLLLPVGELQPIMGGNKTNQRRQAETDALAIKWLKGYLKACFAFSGSLPF